MTTFTADYYKDVFYPAVSVLQNTITNDECVVDSGIVQPDLDDNWNCLEDTLVLVDAIEFVGIGLKTKLERKREIVQKNALSNRWTTLKTLRAKLRTEPTTMEEIDRHITAWMTLETTANALAGGSQTVGFVPMVDW